MKGCTLLASLFLLTTGAAAVLADEKADDKKNLFKEYMEKFGPPGPEHKLLNPLVGNWTAKIKMWMDPNQSPQESEGALERKSILGGRFIHEQFEGKLLDQKCEGIGTIGFDRAKKKFVMTWMDSTSTGLHLSLGTYEDGTKTWTFKHEDVCPITNQPAKSRMTLQIVNDDEQHLEMFLQLGNEKEMRTMAIHLTRKK